MKISKVKIIWIMSSGIFKGTDFFQKRPLHTTVLHKLRRAWSLEHIEMHHKTFGTPVYRMTHPYWISAIFHSEKQLLFFFSQFSGHTALPWKGLRSCWQSTWNSTKWRLKQWPNDKKASTHHSLDWTRKQTKSTMPDSTAWTIKRIWKRSMTLVANTCK